MNDSYVKMLSEALGQREAPDEAGEKVMLFAVCSMADSLRELNANVLLLVGAVQKAAMEGGEVL